MINTPRIALLLGHIPNPIKTNGQIVKPLGEMPTTRDYRPRELINSADSETADDARKRRKRAYYAANRERILEQQRKSMADYLKKIRGTN